MLMSGMLQTVSDRFNCGDHETTNVEGDSDEKFFKATCGFFFKFLTLCQKTDNSQRGEIFTDGLKCSSEVLLIRTFIHHKDRQYKTETETDRIKTRLKNRIILYKK